MARDIPRRYRMPSSHLTWIEINRSAFLGNLSALRRLVGPDVAVAAAVKANAYGHGLHEIVSILSTVGCEYLAVHSIAEAEAARKAGWSRRIMLVGPVLPDHINAVIRLDLEPTIFDPSIITSLGRQSRKTGIPTRIHLKLETGTNRQGMDKPTLAKAIDRLRKYPELHIAGLSTHFANIEDTTNHSYAMAQLKQFTLLTGYLKKNKIKPEMRHTACSAAVLLFPETHFELIRPGISLYGYWPSRETYVSYKLSGGENNILTPALSLKSRITQIKTVEAGSFVGYGCTYRTGTKAKIAILPIGYSDGLDRRLSNIGYVLVKGARAPLRGRVCMNVTMIDITHIPGVRLYDTATILGRDGDEMITADTHGSWCHTINYDILAGLSPLLPRQIL